MPHRRPLFHAPHSFEYQGRGSSIYIREICHKDRLNQGLRKFLSRVALPLLDLGLPKPAGRTSGGSSGVRPGQVQPRLPTLIATPLDGLCSTYIHENSELLYAPGHAKGMGCNIVFLRAYTQGQNQQCKKRSTRNPTQGSFRLRLLACPQT
jgi:hypothetical protein